MLAANAVTGNLNRLFLVVCFGLGAATAVLVDKAIGEGQSRKEVIALSQTLLWFAVLLGGIAGLTALVLRAGYWPIAIATQAECIIKVPLCIWRINSGK